MSLLGQVESILFVASKPLSLKKMASVLGFSEEAVAEALRDLRAKYDQTAGVLLINNNDEWQLVSHPDNKEITENFVKAEISGELTKAQLETLTVISYCGPITKPELEQLRGVNCSLIIRNLMIRGLIKENDTQGLLPSYEVTMDYVRHLGLVSVADLPDYQELHAHTYIATTLEQPEK